MGSCAEGFSGAGGGGGLRGGDGGGRGTVETVAVKPTRVGLIAPASVCEVLEMPYDASRGADPRSKGDELGESRSGGTELGGFGSFGKIPDAVWPSDHLAIGVTVLVGEEAGEEEDIDPI